MLDSISPWQEFIVDVKIRTPCFQKHTIIRAVFRFLGINQDAFLVVFAIRNLIWKFLYKTKSRDIKRLHWRHVFHVHHAKKFSWLAICNTQELRHIFRIPQINISINILQIITHRIIISPPVNPVSFPYLKSEHILIIAHIFHYLDTINLRVRILHPDIICKPPWRNYQQNYYYTINDILRFSVFEPCCKIFCTITCENAQRKQQHNKSLNYMLLLVEKWEKFPEQPDKRRIGYKEYSKNSQD